MQYLHLQWSDVAAWKKKKNSVLAPPAADSPIWKYCACIHQNPQATWNPPASSKTVLRLQVHCSGHTLQAPNNWVVPVASDGWSGEHPSIFSASGGLPAVACMGRLIFF